MKNEDNWQMKALGLFAHIAFGVIELLFDNDKIDML